ncbi:MAG: hypothetical protein GX072_03955 [Lysinibacillus sp.]|nr:hypothetical protein [Lysinibacillus sp.]
MKKLSAILLAFALVFSNVGAIALFDGVDTTVEAKSYKSGKKGFNNSPSSNRIQNDDAGTSGSVNKATTNKNDNTSTTNKNNQAGTTTNKGGFSSGGLMKGLLVGGLAGLLFGSLFADMGLLGNLLGLAINLGAILLVAYLIFKIYFMIKRKNEKEVTENWKR